jgi:Protein of unknown function (DUF1559)
MAIKSSFKQQCPSCEAMVPIRDPNLVGRKIDCPKCKYRFVVEEPADEEPDEAPAKGKKATAVTTKPKAGAKAKDEAAPEKPAKKKGDDDNSTMVWGVGLAVLALALLGVGGWFLFSGDGSSSSGGGRTGTPGGSGNNTPPGQEGGNQPGGKEPKGIADSGINITNLLPNDAQAVLFFNNTAEKGVPRVVPDSTLGTALFGAPGSFDAAAFSALFGFEPGDVRQLALAFNEANNSVFAVVSIPPLEPARRKEDLTRRLQLEPGAKVKEHEYFLLKAHPDPLTVALFKKLSSRQTALHIYDQNTLVLADVKAMEKFLGSGDAGRQPTYLTQPPPPPQKPAPAGGAGGMMGGAGGMPGVPGAVPGGGPMGAGQPMPGGPAPPTMPPGVPGGASGGQPMPGLPGGQPMTPPGIPGLPGTPGSNTPLPSVVMDSFLTVDPSLKRIFDNLDYQRKALVFAATQPWVTATKKKKDAVSQVYETLALGELLKKRAEQLLPGSAEEAEKAQITRAVGMALRELSQDRLAIYQAAETSRPSDAVLIEKGLRTLAARVLPLIEEENQDLKVTLVGARPNQGMLGNQGGAGAMGAEGGMGMMGGGAVPFPPPGQGFMGGVGSPPIIPGQGFRGGQPGQQQPGTAEEQTSRLDLRVNDQVFVISLDLRLTGQDDLFSGIDSRVRELVLTLKNEALTVYHRSQVHDLAAALDRYVKSKGAFPRGTADRPLTGGRVLAWRPDQRLSWLAELLPFLGGAYAEVRIDPGQSWDQGKNRVAATMAIPQFLAADKPVGAYPPRSWCFDAPGLKTPVAATHFVGVAGLGLDAAEFMPGDPATAKKLGVFGYDRQTKPADITDQKESTIAVIQIPANFGTCWLAGGGSTIRGVPEQDSVAPFVCTEYKDAKGIRKGTYAIMCDGKVRFIPADIKQETFRAMCTIAGGETIEDLNRIAPEIKDETVVLKPELPPAAPGGDVKPPVKTPPGGEKPPVGTGSLPKGWKEFTSAKHHFKVAFPGDPTSETFPPGTFSTGESTLYKVVVGDTSYEVYVIGYKEPVKPDQVDAFLEGIAPVGKVRSKVKQKLGNHPGIHVETVCDNGRYDKRRGFLVGTNTVYMVVISKPGKFPDEADAFLKSFQLLP